MAPMLAMNGYVLCPDEVVKYVAFAESVRKTLGNGRHVSSNGTVFPAVNPWIGAIVDCLIGEAGGE